MSALRPLLVKALRTPSIACTARTVRLLPAYQRRQLASTSSET